MDDLTGMELLRRLREARKISWAKIGAELGISRSAVGMWREVPAERVPDVARITGLSRHQLRPDLWDAGSDA